MKVAYLCTTFPVLSETFLQREVVALSAREDVSLELYSLWGGDNTWNNCSICKIPKWKLLSLLYHIPSEGLRNPKGFMRVVKMLFSAKPTSWLNFWENMLGIGIGFYLTRKIKNERVDQLHATWASMPAATALTLHHLLNTPFSFGAHAYDIFESGGDWLLKEKLEKASFVHTSTQNAAHTLKLQCSPPKKIKLIRRGLSTFPPFQKPLRNSKNLHLISVGRLVEKKGYEHQLKIYKTLKQKNIPFKARIIGEGPLRTKLRKKIAAYNLQDNVELLGAVAHQQIFEHYQWADFFLFTGIIASNGDRDGLPNVIPEAMACGVTVLTSNVAGTLEAIHNKETGICCPAEQAETWVEKLQWLHKNTQANERIRVQARNWVEEHFDAHKNTAVLTENLKASAAQKNKFSEETHAPQHA